MKFLKLIFAIVFAIGILIFMCCDGASLISGYVVDSEGNPVADAVVKFRGLEKGRTDDVYEEASRTNESGRFNAQLTHPPFSAVQLRLIFVKTGYITHRTEFTADHAHEMERQHKEFKVILEKETHE